MYLSCCASVKAVVVVKASINLSLRFGCKSSLKSIIIPHGCIPASTWFARYIAIHVRDIDNVKTKIVKNSGGNLSLIFTSKSCTCMLYVIIISAFN